MAIPNSHFLLMLLVVSLHVIEGCAVDNDGGPNKESFSSMINRFFGRKGGLAGGNYYREINEYLCERVPSDDLDANLLEAYNWLAKKQDEFWSKLVSDIKKQLTNNEDSLIDNLEELLELNKWEDDDQEQFCGVKSAYLLKSYAGKLEDFEATQSKGDDECQRVRSIYNHYREKHLADCADFYPNRFEWLRVDYDYSRVSNSLRGVIERLLGRRDTYDLESLNKSPLRHEKSAKLLLGDDGNLETLQAILSRGAIEAYKLEPTEGDAFVYVTDRETLKPTLDELRTRFLFWPCSRYLTRFNEVFEPASLELALWRERQMEPNCIRPSEFYFGWLLYELCLFVSTEISPLDASQHRPTDEDEILDELRTALRDKQGPWAQPQIINLSW